MSGGSGAAPVSITVNDANAAIDPVLIAAIESDLAAGILVAQDAPPDPFVPMAPVGGYTILRNGGSVNAVGQQAIVAGDGAPATIAGGGAAAQIVISGTGGLTFTASSGTATIAAGGTGNTIDLQGGSNTLFTDAGNDTIGAGAGATTILGSGNLIGLGSGSAVVQTNGSDTVLGGTGSETIAANPEQAATASGELVAGGASRLTFIAPPLYINDFSIVGRQSTVLGGSGSDTIQGWGLLAGGSAGNNVIDGTGVLFGGGNGDLLVADNRSDAITPELVAGQGNETLSAIYSDFNTVMFAGNNTTTAGGAVVVANDVMGGATSQSGNVTFFAGTGNAEMIAGPVIGDYGAPRSDLFVFVNGRAGGTDAIYDFNTASRVTLQGYAAGAVAAALATETVAGGSTAIMLPDHTTILFAGVTNLAAADFV